MTPSQIYDDLSWRGLIYQVSDEAKLRDYLSTPGRRMYVGFDPTAPSLHIGNMVPLTALLRFKLAGHEPIFLGGGGTGLIGDPSGKDQERILQTPETIAASLEKIRLQVKSVFANAGAGEPMLVNNLDWLGPLTSVELLRDVGKHFTVNWMMAKDSVKSRIAREEVGISYTEFSYMILQAYDFYHLAVNEDCLLQMGGSDQWGNITAGTELIRRKSGKEAFALTFPLITTADGKKFGKSEKGAIYLDPAMTPVYDFYQYWVRADDRDVIRFLKYFTFLSADEIGALEVAVAERPEQRAAQRRLAQEMTRLVHGEEELAKVEAASQALYGGGDIATVDAATLSGVLQEAPSVNYPALDGLPDVPQMLVDLGLAPSKGRARKDMAAGGVYVNNQRQDDPAWTPGPADLIREGDAPGGVLVLRKGKKHYGLVRVEQG